MKLLKMIKSLFVLFSFFLVSTVYSAVKVGVDFSSGNHKIKGEQTSFYDEPMEFKDNEVTVNVTASKFKKTDFETELAKDEVFLTVQVLKNGKAINAPEIITKMNQKATLEVQDDKNQTYKISLMAAEVP
jgi:hypothetical protein